MDTRRARLKELASRSARLWGLMPMPEYLAGETRVETRNTVYKFRNGICYSARRDGQNEARDPSAFAGMRLVGWLAQDQPAGVLSMQWQPGSYAVLWKPGGGPGGRSAVALTSPSIAFRQVASRSVPAASGTIRRSTPPPLPPSTQRAVPVRPPTPPSFAPLAPPSTTRLHPGSIPPSIPPAPETPTPPRRSVPPPLPARARAGFAPRPFRTPAILS
jgi:hypothetical protein